MDPKIGPFEPKITIRVWLQYSGVLNVNQTQYRYGTTVSDKNSTNFVDTLWIPLISWTNCNDVHKFRGHALNSTNFEDAFRIPLISWTRCSVNSTGNVHFFRGIQKCFPRTRTTATTNPKTASAKPRGQKIKLLKALYDYLFRRRILLFKKYFALGLSSITFESSNWLMKIICFHKVDGV